MKKKLENRDLWIPGLLLLLNLVPMVGGLVRLASLSAPATPESARFVAAPGAIVVHIFCAAVYGLLGAFQFSPGFRRRWPRWHRYAGRVLALCGLGTALTGLWMTVFYEIPRGMQGPLTLVVRLLVGAGMASAIVLAVVAIRRREVARHEAWMIRAYALAQGAGTQALILGPWTLITGDSLGLTRDLLLTLSWAINVALAEWIIRRPRVRVLSPSLA